MFIIYKVNLLIVFLFFENKLCFLYKLYMIFLIDVGKVD